MSASLNVIVVGNFVVDTIYFLNYSTLKSIYPLNIAIICETYDPVAFGFDLVDILENYLVFRGKNGKSNFGIRISLLRELYLF